MKKSLGKIVELVIWLSLKILFGKKRENIRYNNESTSSRVRVGSTLSLRDQYISSMPKFRYCGKKLSRDFRKLEGATIGEKKSFLEKKSSAVI
jgi:hypothetical protein